eukprot:TRINITY_DN1255_c0_g1_i1.p1 TRINITY_DN1255_c0_g1~~TRINITY_DN1255_c0_g1_i1.p1  ORF type:complete len:316 (+),score=85.29 TRINITY_DN1255_c0_g1_i1:46-993(+)
MECLSSTPLSLEGLERIESSARYCEEEGIFEGQRVVRRQALLEEISVAESIDSLSIIHPHIIHPFHVMKQGIPSLKDRIVSLEWTFVKPDFGDVSTLCQLTCDPIPEPVILSILFQVGSALEALHEMERIFRHVDPLRVYLWRNGIVQLGDAAFSEKYGEGTHARQEMLTYDMHSRTMSCLSLYMAPERKSALGIALESDLWGLGLVGLALCLRRCPMSNEEGLFFGDLGDVVPSVAWCDLMADLHPKLDCLRELVDEGQYSENLYILLDQCLAEQPEDRTPIETLMRDSAFDGVVESGDSGRGLVQEYLESLMD